MLVITLCTLRKDRLGFAGGPNPTSPFLDTLSAQGVTFDQHFSQAPWTKPGMGALYTGRYPRELHLDNPSQRDGYREVVREDVTLLAAHLRAAGYATIGAVANPNLKARFGYAQGFDHYTEPDRGYRQDPDIPSGTEIVDDALAALDEVPDEQPVYVRAMLIDAHLPLQYQPLDRLLLTASPTKRTRTYDAALRGIDRQVVRLVERMRARNDNLMVVLTADHGEGMRLPRHHGTGHGNFVYRSTVEVPWVVHHPSLEPHTVDQLSMNVDVLPTLLDLLGVPVPDDVDGRSQAPVIHDPAAPARHDTVFAETFFRGSHRSTAYDGAFQLVRSYDEGRPEGEHRDQLFTADDWEAQTDVAPDQPAALARLQAALDAWEAEQDAAAEAAGDTELADEDADVQEALEALGYVE